MDRRTMVGIAGRGAAAYAGFRLASRIGVHPIVGALAAWVVAGLILDSDSVLLDVILPGKQ